jgi:hypothetical protein
MGIVQLSAMYAVLYCNRDCKKWWEGMVRVIVCSRLGCIRMDLVMHAVTWSNEPQFSFSLYSLGQESV